MSRPSRKIVLVCAEPSGDMLASRLLDQLKQQDPNIQICGIGGPLCQAQGLQSWFNMDELSVMGLVEVIKHLPRLLSIRKELKQKILDFAPDLYIGVDAPDFNLPVAKFAKSNQIQTLHYVSPTIWAWREKRIHKIIASTHHVLGLFPFEAAVYQKYQHPYTFVGHPMADEIALSPSQVQAREALGLSAKEPLLALLPGSRKGEIESMLPSFLATFTELKKQHPNLHALIPAVNDARYAQIQQMIAGESYRDNINITREDARTVMIASDFVLLTSGTATLEAMLCKRPMLSAYKMSRLTYWMMRRLYKPKYFSLPNILAEEALFPELLQDDVEPQRMARYIGAVLSQKHAPVDQTIQVEGSTMTEVSEQTLHHQQQAFVELHRCLQQNASHQAANVVFQMLDQTC